MAFYALDGDIYPSSPSYSFIKEDKGIRFIQYKPSLSSDTGIVNIFNRGKQVKVPSVESSITQKWGWLVAAAVGLCCLEAQVSNGGWSVTFDCDCFESGKTYLSAGFDCIPKIEDSYERRW